MILAVKAWHIFNRVIQNPPGFTDVVSEFLFIGGKIHFPRSFYWHVDFESLGVSRISSLLRQKCTPISNEVDQAQLFSSSLWFRDDTSLYKYLVCLRYSMTHPNKKSLKSFVYHVNALCPVPGSLYFTHLMCLHKIIWANLMRQAHECFYQILFNGFNRLNLLMQHAPSFTSLLSCVIDSVKK